MALREAVLRTWLNVAARNRNVLVLDLFLLVCATYLGYALRLSLLITPDFREDLLKAAVAYPVCVVCVLWLTGVYRVYWPQASIGEYAKLTRGYIGGSALFLTVNFFVQSLSVPRTSLAIMLFAGLFFRGGARASWRLLELSGSSKRAAGAALRRTLIIGAGEAGAYVVRDLQRRNSGLMPLGFIDENPEKRNKLIAGLPVFGDGAALEGVVKGERIEVVLIAIPSAVGAEIRRYVDILSLMGVEVRILPGLHELAGGTIEINRFRSVELQDLLRREPIRLDNKEIGAFIGGKRILVTGAGGSIGTEICEQLLRHDPSELLLMGHGEQSIYNLMERLREMGTKVPYRPIIGDIADYRTVNGILRMYRPNVIFHAAAHKHVPLMEENPAEALRVNALGTWTLTDLAGIHGVDSFVMISSDKAVHPSSVMGATKRIAERLLKIAHTKHPGTRYMAVRFGNVLGSRGSVVPLFERQIRKGGPLTVTHRDMCRYFMLIPEAVSLVLQAASMGRGGELYVLDMGEPVNITEMAETLIRLHGREPYSDVKIIFTGIRAGEKLSEELFYDPDHVDRTSHDKIFLSRLDGDGEQLIDEVNEILNMDDAEGDIKTGIFSLAGGSNDDKKSGC